MFVDSYVLWAVASVVTAFWIVRHLLQLVLTILSRRRPVMVKARRSHTRAWHFYLLYAVSLLNALFHLKSASLQMTIVGVVAIFFGALLSSWAMYHLRRCYSEELEIREGFFLITAGPYRFVRHPMRVGLIGELFGLSVIAGNFAGWVVLLIFLAMSVVRNCDEDKMLHEYLCGQSASARKGGGA